MAQSVRGGVFFFKDVGRTLTLYFNSNSGFHLDRTTRYVTLKRVLQDIIELNTSLSFTLSMVLYKRPQISC